MAPGELKSLGWRGNFLITITRAGCGVYRVAVHPVHPVQGDCTGRARSWLSAVWSLSRIVDSDGDRSQLLDITQIMSSSPPLPRPLQPPVLRVFPPVFPPLPQRSPGQVPPPHCYQLSGPGPQFIERSSCRQIWTYPRLYPDWHHSPGSQHELLAPESPACVSHAKHRDRKRLYAIASEDCTCDCHCIVLQCILYWILEIFRILHTST